MTDLTTEFKPCVFVMKEPKRTEMVLRDCATVWVDPENDDFELGYDMETGELVAVRIYGDRSKLKST